MRDDTNIDCEWSSVTAATIQPSPLDPKVDLRLEWKPTNISFGRFPWNQFIYFGLESWYSSTVEVPWSYGRDEIPHLLTKNNPGITLDLWQKWVDHATQLWIERNESCRQLIQFGNYYSLAYFILITISIFIFYLPENTVSREWFSVIGILFILLLIMDICWGRFRNYELRRCEEKWSNLIQDINLAKWKRNGYIPIVVILLLLIPLMIFVPQQSDYFTIGFWSIMSIAYIYAVAVSSYWTYMEQSNFLRNETKWSDLVQTINARIRKELGLCTNQCYHVSNGNNDLLQYTVGIEFSPLSHLMHPLLEIV